LLLQIGCKQIRRAEARRIQECREKRHTAIACLLGLRICFFLVQRTVTQKRERLIELLESFCPNYWKKWGGSLCNPKKKKKRKKSHRREDDLWSAQIFSSSSLANFRNLQGLRIETKILHDQ
jgi:hypothetical protein